MTFRLEVDVPEGATKIDLAPVLVPIVRELLNKFNSMSLVTLADTESFMESAFESNELDNRIEALRRAWVNDYLRARGWSCEKKDDDKVVFSAKKIAPDPVPEWWNRQNCFELRHHVTIYDDDYEWSHSRFNMLRSGLHAVAKHERLPLEDVIASIEAFAPPLVQLAKTGE